MNGNTGECDFGTLNLTTGAFSKIGASPVNYEGSIAAPIPEPSTFVLLSVGAFFLLAYGWRQRGEIGALPLKRLTTSVVVLLAVFGALMLGAADRARADNLYYAGINNNGTSYTLGTVDSAGHTSVIATGLTFGGAGAENLMFAPNGSLYGFNVGYAGGSGAWGSINPATGAFTQIGNLNAYFPSYEDHTETYGFSLAFASSGNLYVTGWDSSNNLDYGTLNLTTGAFTKIAASPVNFAGSLAAWGNNLYYAGINNNGTSYTFGTVDSAGHTSVIATGLTFGGTARRS